MSDDIEPRARALAERLHADQRYGDLPYRAHLLAVVTTLRRFGVTDPAILAAGWLHDALEDTPLTLGELRRDFPADTAAIVWACTDGEGKNRAERKAEVYRKINCTPNAVVVKLADRIANVEACVRGYDMRESCGGKNGRLFTMYHREHRGFRAALESAPATVDVAPMWAHLESVFNQNALRA